MNGFSRVKVSDSSYIVLFKLYFHPRVTAACVCEAFKHLI